MTRRLISLSYQRDALLEYCKVAETLLVEPHFDLLSPKLCVIAFLMYKNESVFCLEIARERLHRYIL